MIAANSCSRFHADPETTQWKDGMAADVGGILIEIEEWKVLIILFDQKNQIFEVA